MRTPQEQLKVFREMLDGRTLSRESPVFKAALGWLKQLPLEITDDDREELKTRIQRCFRLTHTELEISIAGAELPVPTRLALAEKENFNAFDSVGIERELDLLLPKSGYFRRYVEFTNHSESPLAYHFFSALVGVAATVGRRVYLDMGYFRLFPALGVIILGPSGLRKTTGADIVVGMLTELKCTKIYSEKLTPEALIDAMKGDQACGLIYAPEMAVFLSKQKYMEGIIPLITRFMDCPDLWESGTIMRSTTTLKNVAISSLMCSTVDWFVKNTPEDIFGGGFIARNILVLQESTCREEPIPIPGNMNVRQHLIQELAYIHTIEGAMTLGEETERAYRAWYHEHKQACLEPEHELLATYYQRKSSHVLRVAMSLHLAEHGDLVLCPSCFHRAVAILDWTEKFLPGMLQQMFKTNVGHEADLVLRAVRSVGGAIQHTNLIRKLQYRMNAQQVRANLSSLKEAGLITEVNDTMGHFYKTGESGNGKVG